MDRVWGEYNTDLHKLIKSAIDLALKVYDNPTTANLQALRDLNEHIARKLLLIDAFTRLAQFAVVLNRDILPKLGELPLGRWWEAYPLLLGWLTKAAKNIESLLGRPQDGLTDAQVFAALKETGAALTQISTFLDDLDKALPVAARIQAAIAAAQVVFGAVGVARATASALKAAPALRICSILTADGRLLVANRQYIVDAFPPLHR